MKIDLSRFRDQRRRTTTKGFTLIELVLVLTLLMILMGSAIYFLNQGGFIDTAQSQRVSGDVKAMSTGLELYFAKAGRYPSTEQGIEALITKPTKAPVPDSWSPALDELPTDPWGQPYKYRYPAQKSKKPYDIYSIGKDGQENNEDDMGNWKTTEEKK